MIVKQQSATPFVLLATLIIGGACVSGALWSKTDLMNPTTASQSARSTATYSVSSVKGTSVAIEATNEAILATQSSDKVLAAITQEPLARTQSAVVAQRTLDAQRFAATMTAVTDDLDQASRTRERETRQADFDEMVRVGSVILTGLGILVIYFVIVRMILLLKLGLRSYLPPEVGPAGESSK